MHAKFWPENLKERDFLEGLVRCKWKDKIKIDTKEVGA